MWHFTRSKYYNCVHIVVYLCCAPMANAILCAPKHPGQQFNVLWFGRVEQVILRLHFRSHGAISGKYCQCGNGLTTAYIRVFAFTYSGLIGRQWYALVYVYSATHKLNIYKTKTRALWKVNSGNTQKTKSPLRKGGKHDLAIQWWVLQGSRWAVFIASASSS